MNYRRIVAVVIVAAATAAVLVGPSYAALHLEGQSGVFLNTLAYTLPSSKTEIATHYVNLDDLGTVQTYNISAGLAKDVEVGFTRVGSSVTGVKDQDVLLAKWQAVKETKTAPALALWGIRRALVDGGNSVDIGASATKIVTIANRPTVLDLGVRSTKALGLGLFGFGPDRKIKFEGSLAVFVTKNFAVGTEFKQQIGSRTWKDIAFRYVASNKLNVDLGFANLGPGIDNQVALATTYSW